MTTALAIRAGQASDLAVASSWLDAAGLPTDDLTVAHMQDFLVALIDEQPAGMIGLERLGRVGLLRSLVVDPSSRSKGLGAQLVNALERHAATLGIAELWLLTIDADQYFVKLGYARVERADAPTAVRDTAEFSSLCPGDAVLMRKTL